MAKANLEMGFLFLYEWLPLFETLNAKEAGELMLAMMKRQQSGDEIPQFKNPLMNAYAKVMDATVTRRLAGRVASKRAEEDTGGQHTPTQGERYGGTLSEEDGSHHSGTASEAKRSVANISEYKRNDLSASGEGEACKDTTRSEEYFAEFWASYPRKIGKAAAKKIFLRLKPTRKLTDEMLRSIEKQKTSEQWTRDGGRFIPHPTTWLSRGQWDDETEEQSYGIYHPPHEDDLGDILAPRTAEDLARRKETPYV